MSIQKHAVRLSDAAIQLTVKPFEGFDRTAPGVRKMGVPWVDLFSAGSGHVKYVGRDEMRLLCGHKGNTEGETAALKRN